MKTIHSRNTIKSFTESNWLPCVFFKHYLLNHGITYLYFYGQEMHLICLFALEFRKVFSILTLDTSIIVIQIISILENVIF